MDVPFSERETGTAAQRGLGKSTGEQTSGSWHQNRLQSTGSRHLSTTKPSTANAAQQNTLAVFLLFIRADCDMIIFDF